MSDKVIVYEILKREDGSARGRGNSKEVSKDEAVELIKAGTHRAESPLEIKLEPKKKEAPKEEKIEDGDHND